MLALEPIREDRVYWWAISQITQRKSSDVQFQDTWDQWGPCLDGKRQDYHYPDVVKSIQDHGFIRPLNADTEYGELRLSDGHHRLAVAIDMQMEAVPVLVSSWKIISDDSGLWEAGDPVEVIDLEWRAHA